MIGRHWRIVMACQGAAGVMVTPAELDAAVDFLERTGRAPYFLMRRSDG